MNDVSITLQVGNAAAHWLRHCATSWKVMGLVPDGVSLEFFIDIILPALGSTQPLTEMSTRNTSCG